MYPWIKIPVKECRDIFKTLGTYKPRLHHCIVKWELPYIGVLKCNIDRACKVNLGMYVTTLKYILEYKSMHFHQYIYLTRVRVESTRNNVTSN